MNKKQIRIIIGAASETQFKFGIGVDTWKDKAQKYFYALCTERGTFEGYTPLELTVYARGKRKLGLIGGMKDGRNNSPKLNELLRRDAAIIDHFGIDYEYDYDG